ncbi:MAG: phenolic acid decarboxylase [Paludibacteraceae bacterium]
MKKIILAMIVSTMIVSCKNETKKIETSQSAITTTEAVLSLPGKKLEYNYGKNAYEVQFKTENTLHWKCIKGDEKGRESDETYYMHRLDNHSLFVTWIEADGLGVSQVINLKDKTINCFLKIDKEVVPLSGTIREL